MMTPHIEAIRLADLTRMDYILDQPEWMHIRTCEACLDKYASIVEYDLKHRELDGLDSISYS